MSVQWDTERSPQLAAKVAWPSPYLSHHHEWWHCDRSHDHADPSSQVNTKEKCQLFIYFTTHVCIKCPSWRRFDVGPILNQELHHVPEKCTADELGTALAFKGAHLVSLGNTSNRKKVSRWVLTKHLCLRSSLQLMETLKILSDKLAQKKEQSKISATFGM